MTKKEFLLKTLAVIVSYIFLIVLLFQSNISAQNFSRDLAKVCTELDTPSFDASGERERFWKKKVLNVRFLNGSQFVRDKVKQFAPVWSRYANIKFNFVDTGAADIRVAFKYKNTANAKEDQGSWSYIGTGALAKENNEPTMNFGWFDETTGDEEFRRTVLHEFGHALGMIHEHQSPSATFEWNKPAVYQYYEQSQNWNAAKVENNIFRKYNSSQTQFTDYDPNSIMHYSFPKEFILAGSAVGWNTDLSENDKLFISAIYPRAALSLYKVSGTNIESAIDSTNSLILKTGDKFRLKFAAPFNGYVYAIGNSADGNFLINPYMSSQVKVFNKGQQITLGFKITGAPSAENILVIFLPIKLNSSKLSAMLNSTSITYDKERMRLPNPGSAFPAAKGLGVVSSLTCGYATAWLGETLGLSCNEVEADTVVQPVILRVSYQHN